MSSPKPSISTEEFDALPSSIQRKYFSNQERMAIAQQSAVEKRQRQPSKKSSASSSSTLSSTIPTAAADSGAGPHGLQAAFTKRRKTFARAQQRRSSLPSAWNVELVLDNNDPSWFDTLPDKVKRSQFSKQEIDAIGACKAQEIDRPRTGSAPNAAFETVSWTASQPKLRPQASFHSPSVSISPSTCSNQTTHSAPQISALHSPMSASAASSRSSPASPAVPSLSVTSPYGRTAAMKRSSNRRPFITPIPLPPPILAPEPSLPSPDTTSYLDKFKTLDAASARALEDETTPTQEREDTRFNLTSAPPLWYDEKLDFDFDRNFHKTSLSTYTSGSQRTMSPSVSDAASCDTSGPMTPISPAVLPQSFDQTMSRMQPLPRPSSSSIVADTAHNNSGITNFSHPQHHLTHHESLPRLRSTRQSPRHLVDGFYEDQQAQPYSITVHYSKDDPLALETLPVCDDVTGAHGAFAVPDDHHPSSNFRKVLKVIRGH